jgi:serine/threonine protein kinase
LVKIIKGIAVGMSHLHNNNIIHKDLAARNILLTKHFEPKISDFGLSRLLADEDYYKFANTSKIPIRWYAPEVFLYHRYTIYSDIWSFGITCWEILELGKQPYYSILNNEDVVKAIIDGTKLNRPVNCIDNLWNIIDSCWKYDPEERYKFIKIVEMLP